jgi:hypothetical protein
VRIGGIGRDLVEFSRRCLDVLKGVVAAQHLPSGDKIIVIVAIGGNSVLLRPAYHPPTRLPRPWQMSCHPRLSQMLNIAAPF